MQAALRTSADDSADVRSCGCGTAACVKFNASNFPAEKITQSAVRRAAREPAELRIADCGAAACVKFNASNFPAFKVMQGLSYGSADYIVNKLTFSLFFFSV